MLLYIFFNLFLFSQWGTFRDWKVSASVSPGLFISICLMFFKIRPSCEGQEGTSMAWHQKLQERLHHCCSPCSGLSVWSHRLSLHYTASFDEGDVFDWRRKGEKETNRDRLELAFGLCTVYSSEGCTFLRPDHMTGEMGGRVSAGATIVGLNYPVDQMWGWSRAG